MVKGLEKLIDVKIKPLLEEAMHKNLGVTVAEIEDDPVKCLLFPNALHLLRKKMYVRPIILVRNWLVHQQQFRDGNLAHLTCEDCGPNGV